MSYSTVVNPYIAGYRRKLTVVHSEVLAATSRLLHESGNLFLWQPCHVHANVSPLALHRLPVRHDSIAGVGNARKLMIDRVILFRRLNAELNAYMSRLVCVQTGLFINDRSSTSDQLPMFSESISVEFVRDSSTLSRPL